ncbi:MAG: Na/Pi cotransporter family protein, partial [Clostridia bacterium]|nr:Na/Pi cotransporter family protein [Clostridia bacterium]
MSGGMLERTLERTTSSRIKAVLLGAGVTAVIQSSSATTVMTVGFVNGGIMTLSQSAGVIMGANIGTTVTAWILSLAGVEGSSIWVQLLKPSSFSPVLAAVGAALVLFAKQGKKRTIGTILCGFAVLMYGMNMMSGAVEPLSNMPAFASFMTMFRNPLLGVLAGLIITAVIQSSSASLGMLQALSMTGGVSFGVAIPIIMGQNIGTCVTALLSCIGASKNARRTAMVHLYFNIIGTLLFLAVFYALNAVLRFSFLDQAIDPAMIAVFHTGFNLGATALLLPFSDQLCRLATLTIPDGGKKTEEEWPLDERFLGMPAFALEQCKGVLDRMASLSHETILLALSTLEKYDARVVAQVEENEAAVDRYEDRLGDYLVRLSTRQLLPKDSRTIGEYLHVIGDLERISDHAINITEVAQEMYDKGIAFSAAARAELAVFVRALTEILTLATDALKADDADLARSVEPLEDVIDALHAEVKSRHVQRLQSGECTIELGFVLSDLLTNLERVSDHCSN